MEGRRIPNYRSNRTSRAMPQMKSPAARPGSVAESTANTVRRRVRRRVFHVSQIVDIQVFDIGIQAHRRSGCRIVVRRGGEYPRPESLKNRRLRPIGRSGTLEISAKMPRVSCNCVVCVTADVGAWAAFARPAGHRKACEWGTGGDLAVRRAGHYDEREDIALKSGMVAVLSCMDC